MTEGYTPIDPEAEPITDEQGRRFGYPPLAHEPEPADEEGAKPEPEPEPEPQS